MTFYRHFNLLMDRSHGFGSTTHDLNRPIKTRFRFGFIPLVLNLAMYNNSSDRSTKSTPPHFNVLRLLVSTRFQVLFHSPPGVLFTFPSQYCFTIGHRGVLRLGGWSPRLPTRFLVSRGTLVPDLYTKLFAYATFTLFGLGFPTAHSAKFILHSLWSATPTHLRVWVWPRPLSLATTYGVSVDFSS